MAVRVVNNNELDLKIMACDTYHLTTTDHTDTCHAIIQGATYYLPVIYYPEDISTWVVRGQIRKNYADLEPTVLANFSFNPIVYGSTTLNGVEASRSMIRGFIPANITATIPTTPRLRKSVADRAIIGTNVWVYAIEIASPSSEVIRLLNGFVEVELEVVR
jgi:hypothetical protein